MNRPTIRHRPFSLRHAKAILAGRIQIDLSADLRRRIWSTLQDRNEPIHYSEPDNPGWINNSSILEEAEVTLGRLLGLDEYDENGRRQPHDLHLLLTRGEASAVFDLLEIAFAYADPGARPEMQLALNDSFVDFACPWRLSDGMIFRMDSQFLETEVLERATDLLGAPELEGAQAEFLTARDKLTDGSTRDAITYAAHSVESTAKAMLGTNSGVATDLFRQLGTAGFLDDLPASKRAVVTKALNGVGLLRNELGGHGQGASVIDLPRPYGELAVHLAAAINHFLVTQLLRKTPAPEPEPEPEVVTPTRSASRPYDINDDIPF